MEFISLCENNLDSQKLLSNKIPDMTISKKWTIHEKDTLRKYLMIFGFNRWSVIKQSTTGILTEKSDVEMRAFANSFLRCIIDSITAENQSLKEFLTSLINEEPDDPLVISHPDDWGVLMKQKAIAWGKRIQLINRVNVLVEKFISEQNKNIDLREQAESAENKEELMGQVNLTYDNWENLLNFLPVNAFYGQRPVGWWTRTNDIDLIRGTYKWGYANYTSMRNDPDLSFIQMEKDCNFQDFPNADTITRRLKKLMQIVSKSETENGDINFEDTSGLKEPTGFTLSEKRDILKVMTVIGIPLTAEGKSDWNKMKEMLNKELPDIQIKQVQQLESIGVISITGGGQHVAVSIPVLDAGTLAFGVIFDASYGLRKLPAHGQGFAFQYAASAVGRGVNGGRSAFQMPVFEAGHAVEGIIFGALEKHLATEGVT